MKTEKNLEYYEDYSFYNKTGFPEEPPTFTFYNLRNVNRLVKEINFYKYPISYE